MTSRVLFTWSLQYEVTGEGGTEQPQDGEPAAPEQGADELGVHDAHGAAGRAARHVQISLFTLSPFQFSLFTRVRGKSCEPCTRLRRSVRPPDHHVSGCVCGWPCANTTRVHLNSEVAVAVAHPASVYGYTGTLRANCLNNEFAVAVAHPGGRRPSRRSGTWRRARR